MVNRVLHRLRLATNLIDWQSSGILVTRIIVESWNMAVQQQMLTALVYLDRQSDEIQDGKLSRVHIARCLIGWDGDEASAATVQLRPSHSVST